MVYNTQIQEDCPGDPNVWFRHIHKGAWPFSTRDHGWLISDCTAEGLKVSEPKKVVKKNSKFHRDTLEFPIYVKKIERSHIYFITGFFNVIQTSIQNSWGAIRKESPL